MLANVEWGEYRIGDLFESSTGNVDIQKSHINGKGSYVITAGLNNNGILGMTDLEAKIFNENTLTVDMFGIVFYRPFKYKLVTHARVYSLKPKFVISNNHGIFLSSAFHFLKSKYGFDNMCTWEKIKDDKISLPVKNGKIDFMERFIAELDAYLSVTGLKDYELSEEEQKVLEVFEKSRFDEFNITDIFDIKNTGNILSRDIALNSGTVPYLCASAENNAVSSYISYDEKYLDEGNSIFIGGKTFIVTYQGNDFYSNDSHNLVLYLKNEKRTKLKQLYLATCVYKSLSHKYFWGDSVSKAKIIKDKITLPAENDKPNFSIMETFISAIQKLVIKDVVMYTDLKMTAAKMAVTKK